MEKVRIIKRYQNRKLYDTHQSCYVTLEEIAQIIREGNEIKVIDNKTQKDITYTTQIQLLFDQEKKSKGPENTELLKRVIRSESGIFTGYIKSLESKLGLGNHAAEEKFVEEEKVEMPAPEVANYLNNVNTGIETPNTLN
ncbi:MAG: polyhydroxyalkanoate synthesis regulator DNA-binding domain-containing protein [Halobacteriovoraceae bacterium]|nr:polyhydroxyalkanoate synthesis regulator DNA-binding domain-containing protein [Halobacteriovoraceae bacterium]